MIEYVKIGVLFLALLTAFIVYKRTSDEQDDLYKVIADLQKRIEQQKKEIDGMEKTMTSYFARNTQDIIEIRHEMDKLSEELLVIQQRLGMAPSTKIRLPETQDIVTDYARNRGIALAMNEDNKRGTVDVLLGKGTTEIKVELKRNENDSDEPMAQTIMKLIDKYFSEE